MLKSWSITEVYFDKLKLCQNFSNNFYSYFKLTNFQWTINRWVISSDNLHKDGNVQFQTGPFMWSLIETI